MGEQIRKPGRPRKAAGDTADTNINIRITFDMKREWYLKAEKAGCKNVGEWIRKLAQTA